MRLEGVRYIRFKNVQLCFQGTYKCAEDLFERFSKGRFLLLGTEYVRRYVACQERKKRRLLPGGPPRFLLPLNRSFVRVKSI